ncbi:twin-argninine leader-binding protein for DmsA and TorA [Haemophilus pittmaniae]|uniref:Probable Tat proofreading chaperone DmsD n=1 Tax=Haemophilus pittmaniae TaxID=249188 RepID=A0A377J292_9PAST|nr:Tat proofreading chaperone DmsD [Haemophilus pittmaniae]STO93990.1 twin-argninine leader-binding protein for DmsA and TorA [Haemophilus pittmaniae]
MVYLKNELPAEIALCGRLLGALLYYPPQDERLAPMRDFFQHTDWPAAWPFQQDQALLTEAAALLAKDPQDALDEQYQRLFIGPNALPAPPWGSVYLDKESVIFGDSLLELRAFMRQHGIHFETALDEPEDHIGLMLMLSAYLAENNPSLLPEFFSQHLLTWAPHQLSLLAAQQDCPFYAALALLAKQALNEWQQAYRLEVPERTLYR